MEKDELTRIRKYLKKTQYGIAQITGHSVRTVQSYEQGWRHIPHDFERELILLLCLKNFSKTLPIPCWEQIDCPVEFREKCIVWEHNIRHFCWVINGTFCHGEFQGVWAKKIKICRQCPVFLSMMPDNILNELNFTDSSDLDSI